MSSEKKTMEEVIDKIVKEWADKGKIIEGGWLALVATGGLEDAPFQQKQDMRKAFFLGAQHLYACMIGMLESGEEPTKNDMERMEKIMLELEKFRMSLVH